jgi:hypothetical protein
MEDEAASPRSASSPLGSGFDPLRCSGHYIENSLTATKRSDFGRGPWRRKSKRRGRRSSFVDRQPGLVGRDIAGRLANSLKRDSHSSARWVPPGGMSGRRFNNSGKEVRTVSQTKSRLNFEISVRKPVDALESGSDGWRGAREGAAPRPL